MKKEKDWELESKKETKRWIWTLVVVVIIIAGIRVYSDYQTYTEKTVIQLAESLNKDFKKESYTMGTILITADPPINRNKIRLTNEAVTELMNQLQDTYIKGLKGEFKTVDGTTTYSVLLEDENGTSDLLGFYIERDEQTQRIIFSIFKGNRYTADFYFVEGEELYNLISKLVE